MPPKRAPIELGQRFGRLTVLEYCQPQKDPKHPKYRCRCDCGNETLVQTDNLKRTNSCGCLRVEQLRERSVTHGLSSSPEFRVWCDIRQRCSLPSRKEFHLYGGRGITVCARWLESFENFYADMGPRPSAKHSIDRIECNGNYEPTNCRWATAKEQRINQRRQSLHVHNGVTGTVKDLAAHFGANPHTVHDRMWRLGFDIHDAIAEGIRVNSRKS